MKLMQNSGVPIYQQIADSFKTDILAGRYEQGEFFTDSEPEQIVYKANDYFEKIDEGKNSKVEWIIPNAQTRSMEPVRLTLHPGGSSEIYLPQECEEFGYVIKGTVKLCYGGKVHTVKAGESFYFKAGKKHFIENKSSKDAMLIWVSNPPSF